MKFCNFLKIIREAKGISQEYMASQLNVSQATYSRYETGQIRLSLDKVKLIIQLLEIDVVNLPKIHEYFSSIFIMKRHNVN